MRNIPENISIEKYFLERNFNKYIGETKIRVCISYSLGIIRAIKEPKLVVISTETGVSVLSLSEFINDEFGIFKADSIFEEEIKKVEELSDIILDSFVVPRENNKKTKTRTVFCSSQKRGLKGLEYLVMIAVKGNKTKVVGVVRLNKKPDLINASLNLLEIFLEQKKINSVKADNHFFHEILINYLNDREITFISKPKVTTIWSDKKLKECFKDIPVEGYRYNPSCKLYTRGLVLTHKIYGTCKIVKVKPEYNCEDSKAFYIVSTNINLSVMDIVRGKKQRWKIETVFRDCSQNLGLRSCQCTSDNAIDNHIFMSFFTYNFLSEIKQYSSLTIGAIKRRIQTNLSVTTNVSDFFKLKYA